MNASFSVTDKVRVNNPNGEYYCDGRIVAVENYGSDQEAGYQVLYLNGPKCGETYYHEEHEFLGSDIPRLEKVD